jgi:hypothetical protein
VTEEARQRSQARNKQYEMHTLAWRTQWSGASNYHPPLQHYLRLLLYWLLPGKKERQVAVCGTTSKKRAAQAEGLHFELTEYLSKEAVLARRDLSKSL